MLSDGDMVQRRNMHRTASDSAPLSVYFLIANARLEFSVNHRKDSPLKISNRKYFAIFCRAFWAFSRFDPQASSLQSLIETPRLEITATIRRSNKMQNSNRDKNRVLRPPRRNSSSENHASTRNTNSKASWSTAVSCLAPNSLCRKAEEAYRV